MGDRLGIGDGFAERADLGLRRLVRVFGLCDGKPEECFVLRPAALWRAEGRADGVHQPGHTLVLGRLVFIERQRAEQASGQQRGSDQFVLELVHDQTPSVVRSLWLFASFRTAMNALRVRYADVHKTYRSSIGDPYA